ncbi:TPA: AAA family ATPase [Candidatus Collierbacteria bacterium]|nr:MAG: AAA ATPase [Candidatus Beckwithbacteria bacterium GW2011_GWC2_49_11]HBC44838.1 AAA family ATPase [Candidatus Collierbacteria bacterium]
MTQGQALSILKLGANVFLTGEPGSGKTHTVNLYIQYLREHGINVAVTASTGIAATHLGGTTIHSWSGIGIKKELTDRDLAALCNNSRLVNKVRKTKVLIIDEISMLEARTLFAVENATKVLCGNTKPLGGLQVVFVGDFFQLPPIPQENEDVKFAFESPSWDSAKPVVCYLSEQYRQNDKYFTSILKSIRNRDGLSQIYQILSARKVDVTIEKTITRLYSHNIDVDTINSRKLTALAGEEHTFQMTSLGRKTLIERIKKSCLSPETLILKKGARVIFTKNNFERGFVNGTLGEIVAFNENGIPIVLTKQNRKIEASPMEWSIEEQDKVLASVTQIPLRLAWALTVHKGQGMTLDSAIVDLSDAFEYGQGYVAISRVRSLSGLFLLGLNKRALEVHPKIADIDIHFRKQSIDALKLLNKISEADLLNKQVSFIRVCGGKKKKQTEGVSERSYSVELIRKKYKNAYRPWSNKEDADLKRVYQSGKKVYEIADMFGRQPGSIRSRLTKLELLEISV